MIEFMYDNNCSIEQAIIENIHASIEAICKRRMSDCSALYELEYTLHIMDQYHRLDELLDFAESELKKLKPDWKLQRCIIGLDETNVNKGMREATAHITPDRLSRFLNSQGFDI